MFYRSQGGELYSGRGVGLFTLGVRFARFDGERRSTKWTDRFVP